MSFPTVFQSATARGLLLCRCPPVFKTSLGGPLAGSGRPARRARMDILIINHDFMRPLFSNLTSEVHGAAKQKKNLSLPGYHGCVRNPSRVRYGYLQADFHLLCSSTVPYTMTRIGPELGFIRRATMRLSTKKNIPRLSNPRERQGCPSPTIVTCRDAMRQCYPLKYLLQTTTTSSGSSDQLRPAHPLSPRLRIPVHAERLIGKQLCATLIHIIKWCRSLSGRREDP